MRRAALGVRMDRHERGGADRWSSDESPVPVDRTATEGSTNSGMNLA